MLAADVVQKFIENIGQRHEAEYWLQLFRGEAKERFATLVIEPSVLEMALDAVVMDLRFLAAVELTPVVVVGLIDPNDSDGHAFRLHRALQLAGVSSVVLRFADAGEDAAAIVAATHRGQVPVIPFGDVAGSDPEARFACLARLLTKLRAHKLICLSRAGAIVQDGMPVQFINLTTEYETAVASRELTASQRVFLQQSRRLVMEQVPHKLLVAVTSPLDLLRELFTVKGAGTLLRRGASIQVRTGYAEVDSERLAGLLTRSFGRAPAPGFFERLVSRVYLEDEYLGAAIIVDTPLGGYLSKFAVDRQAQGEGMGRDLWERITADFSTLFWRARATNPINTWYMKQCDGFYRTPSWLCFWKGLEPQRIADAIDFSLRQPIDMGAPDDPRTH